LTYAERLGEDAVALPDVVHDTEENIAEALALKLEGRGELLEAREILLRSLALSPRDKQIEEALGRINVALLTTPRMMPGKVEYVIKPGDSMAKIASEFVCPVLLIQKINNIANPDRIRPGDVLRVMDRPKFAIEVSKRDNTLLVTLDGKFFKRYSVGTGTYGTTPVGTFDIDDKIEDPPWWKDGKAIPFGDPENILGTRWMRIKATGDTTPVSGYGIHGTWENDSIGKQSSAGCIRMRNADVEEVYMMVPRGTPVTIVE
jgi:LysM repeat protein